MDKEETSKDTAVVFARQRFDFYDIPSLDFDEIRIGLQRGRDSGTRIEIKEDYLLDNRKVIGGSTLLVRTALNQQSS